MALRNIPELTATVGDRMVKVYRDAEWDEYRARLYVNGVLQPEADYHTDDRDDAKATAWAMARWVPKG